MLGGIYTEEKCQICGRTMADNGRAVACPSHKKQIAYRLRVIMKHKGQWVRKRFTNYEEARRFLTGIQFKIDEGSFDARDYQSDNPLGFANLADQWLNVKKIQIKRRSWNNLRNYMGRAVDAWGNRNIKEITYAEIEDFLFNELADVSSKSRSNARSVLNSFFDWLLRRRVLHISQLPEIPSVGFELEFRKTVDKETQQAILSEVHRISSEVNPRIWIAIRWLATYFSIRPGELIRIKEGEIDTSNGFILVPHPKEKKPKAVPMIDEDIELVKALPKSFPELPFFRHLRSIGGSRAGDPFGQRYLYKWWKKACSNLGIEGVDLYGGTRHSTVMHLGQFFTPEELKAASFHSTNKAFERYYRAQPDSIKNIYSFDSPAQSVRGKTKGKRNLPLGIQKD